MRNLTPEEQMTENLNFRCTAQEKQILENYKAVTNLKYSDIMRSHIASLAIEPPSPDSIPVFVDNIRMYISKKGAKSLFKQLARQLVK